MNREATRQAEMKQVQTMPTAADRLRTVCFSFTDVVTKTRLYQRSRRTLMNVFLTRSKEQNIKEINILLGPSSPLLAQAPSLFGFQLCSLCWAQLKSISACLSSQPKPALAQCCTVPFLLFKGLLGPPSRTGNGEKPVTIVNLSLIFPHIPKS